MPASSQGVRVKHMLKGDKEIQLHMTALVIVDALARLIAHALVQVAQA